MYALERQMVVGRVTDGKMTSNELLFAEKGKQTEEDPKHTASGHFIMHGI